MASAFDYPSPRPRILPLPAVDRSEDLVRCYLVAAGEDPDDFLSPPSSDAAFDGRCAFLDLTGPSNSTPISPAPPPVHGDASDPLADPWEAAACRVALRTSLLSHYLRRDGPVMRAYARTNFFSEGGTVNPRAADDGDDEVATAGAVRAAIEAMLLEVRALRANAATVPDGELRRHREAAAGMLLESLEARISDPLRTACQERTRDGVARVLRGVPSLLEVGAPDEYGGSDWGALEPLDPLGEFGEEDEMLDEELVVARPGGGAADDGTVEEISVWEDNISLDLDEEEKSQDGGGDVCPLPAETVAPRPPAPAQPAPWENSRSREEEEMVLREENAALSLRFASEATTARGVETSVASMAGLFMQFSGLLEEQRTAVWELGNNAETAVQNVRKGEENLVDAAARKGKGGHYTAKFFVVLGVVLLFLNYINP